MNLIKVTLVSSILMAGTSSHSQTWENWHPNQFLRKCIKVANEGSLDAMHMVYMMASNRSSSENYNKKAAARYLEHCAFKEEPVCLYDYSEELAKGNLFEKSAERSGRYLMRAAVLNNRKALHFAGMKLIKGEDTFPKELDIGIDFLKKSATRPNQRNYPNPDSVKLSQEELGYIYLYGDDGLKPDLDESLKWFTLAKVTYEHDITADARSGRDNPADEIKLKSINETIDAIFNDHKLPKLKKINIVRDSQKWLKLLQDAEKKRNPPKTPAC